MPRRYFTHFLELLSLIEGLDSDIPQERIAALETIAHEARIWAKREKEALQEDATEALYAH